MLLQWGSDCNAGTLYLWEPPMNDASFTFEILPDRPLVLNNRVSSIDILVQFQTLADDGAPSHVPSALDLCIVLDCSSSMDGDKLQTAKRVCRQILDRIRDTDRFIVVTFSDEARLLVDSGMPRDRSLMAIQDVIAQGNTNLAAGWRMGLMQVQTDSPPNASRQIFLLTDGQTNVGETRLSVLRDEAQKAFNDLSVTTTTFGIGRDFQESLLFEMAAASNGNFWFSEDDNFGPVLEKEFGGVTSIVLERPTVSLSFPPGIVIEQPLNTLPESDGRSEE